MKAYLKKGCFILLFLLGVQYCNAQSTDRKAQAEFDKAQYLITDRDYPKAIAALKDAVSADSKFQLAWMQLADLYRKSKQYEEAIPCYRKAIDLGGLTDFRVFYGLGESLLLSGDYETARENFSIFKTKYTGKDSLIRNKAKKYIKDCDFALNALKNPVKFMALNLGNGVNSIYRDYFPSITADGQTMIFSRKIAENEDFYLSNKKDGKWGTATPLSNTINTTKYNEGAQSLSPDGLYLFFTGCNRPDGLGRCDIYVSRKEGNDWGVPFNLGAPVNSEYWDAQPSISPDGNTLYFVSNRPGGFGGYDIWKSSLNEDGTWQQPVNLGPEINTPYDEQTPFIHPDGKSLYFSSDGWPGFGNKDLYISRMDAAGKWGIPQNLGSPINTFREETGLIVSPDGRKAYFSADLKEGYGDMDIYEFELPENIRPKEITYVKGIVKDKETKQPLEANIRVVNLKTGLNQFNDHTSNVNGEFLAVMPIGNDYLLNAEADGYLFYSDHFALNDIHITAPQQLQIYLEKIKPGITIVLKNIFFDTNKYDLLPGSITELGILIQLLNTNKGLHIEIQGHTDQVGLAAQNQKLSEQRAKAVYDYLLQHQIPADRLSFKGYGESRPIAPNDSEQGRQQNRRTSFLVTRIN